MSNPADSQDDARPIPPGERPVELVTSPPRRLAPADLPRLYAYPREEEGVHFWDFWHVLNCRRWSVISFFIA